MEWIVQNGEKLGVTLMLIIAIYGRYRQWWVDGPTHTELKTRLETRETELKALADEARESARIQEEASRAEISELRHTLTALVAKIEGPSA